MITTEQLRWGTRLLWNSILPVLFVTLGVVPVRYLDQLPSLCVYKNLFGIRCPGCGMTDAFCSILHGNSGRHGITIRS